MAATDIEWTDATWNPVVGCTVLSPGCTNCYAMRMAARLDAMDPSPVAEAQARVCQFHERSVSRGCTRSLHPQRSGRRWRRRDGIRFRY